MTRPSGIWTYRDRENGMRVKAVQINHVDMCYQIVDWIEEIRGRGSSVVALTHDASRPESSRVTGVYVPTAGGKPRRAELKDQHYIVQYQNNEFDAILPAPFEEQYELESYEE